MKEHRCNICDQLLFVGMEHTCSKERLKENLRKDNKIYVTTMHRWGDEGCHSYVVYVGFDYVGADKAGSEEVIQRGKKYDYSICEYKIDIPKSRKYIRKCR